MLQHVAGKHTHMWPVGVDAAKIPTALKRGWADGAILQKYMPRHVTNDYHKTRRIDNIVKDLNVA